MKLKLLLSITSIFCYTLAFSQNYIYKGEKRYPSTPTWEFKVNASSTIRNAEICIAKHGSGGYLMLSVQSQFSYLSGNVLLYLNDGNVITCIDRNIKDKVDNQSISLYNLTYSEIEKLKNARINSIRFSIIDNYGISKDSYTATNEYKYEVEFDNDKIQRAIYGDELYYKYKPSLNSDKSSIIIDSSNNTEEDVQNLFK